MSLGIAVAASESAWLEIVEEDGGVVVEGLG